MSESNQLIARLRQVAGVADDQPFDGNALIGLLQRYRPDGRALAGLFDGVPGGPSLASRLSELYQVAGQSYRPGGGQDAYFIVRTPPTADVDAIRDWASRWLASLHALAVQTDHAELAAVLTPLPKVRVLEGIAPKHTRGDLEVLPLYRAFKKQAAELVERLPTRSQIPAWLGPAYYYAACDWALRDYLLWPAYADTCGLDDPFAAYFQLWRHGAKLRSFSDDTLDVYLPHGSAE